MKNMRIKQHGIGFIGWSTILAVFGFFILMGLRAWPLYQEKFAVMAAMNSVANRPDAAKISTKDARKYFLRNIEINMNTVRFTDWTVKDLVKVTKDKKTKKRYLRVTYEGRNEFIKELKFLIEFDHQVELGGSG